MMVLVTPQPYFDTFILFLWHTSHLSLSRSWTLFLSPSLASHPHFPCQHITLFFPSPLTPPAASLLIIHCILPVPSPTTICLCLHHLSLSPPLSRLSLLRALLSPHHHSIPSSRLCTFIAFLPSPSSSLSPLTPPHPHLFLVPVPHLFSPSLSFVPPPFLSRSIDNLSLSLSLFLSPSLSLFLFLSLSFSFSLSLPLSPSLSPHY